MHGGRATFNCGHARTPENTIGIVRQFCRTCRHARYKAELAETPHHVLHLEYRVRALPVQIKNCREKLWRLEAEARRYGMLDLLNDARFVNAAWERTIGDAKASNSEEAA